MQWPRFITFKHEDHVYILQTAFPNYLGRVMKYDNDWTMYQAPGEPKCQITDYRIMVTFSGCLQGNYVLMGDKNGQLQKLINDMAFFYFTERIVVDPKRYERYKQ